MGLGMGPTTLWPQGGTSIRDPGRPALSTAAHRRGNTASVSGDVLRAWTSRRRCRNPCAVVASADNCGVIIPCHNEADSIAGVVRRIRVWLPRVLVVDDGSSDATGDQARSAGAGVLRQPVRSGKGAALAAGWTAAAAAGWEWVLLMDGDGQHLPEESAALLAAAVPSRPLIIGNRLLHPQAMPPLRRAINRWMSRQLSRLAGVALPDSQCGYRLAHLPTLLSLELATRHFEIESEMCVAFARAGLDITFVPVTASYGPERSKICPLVDAWRWTRWYLHARHWDRERSIRLSVTAPRVSSAIPT